MATSTADLLDAAGSSRSLSSESIPPAEGVASGCLLLGCYMVFLMVYHFVSRKPITISPYSAIVIRES